MFRSALRLSLIAASFVWIAAAQDQPPGHVVDQCIKANPGKVAEITAYTRDVAVKSAQVDIDEGRAAWWLTLSAISPVGSEARCDFHIVTGYKGYPPEPGAATAAQTAARLKKAGISQTADELAAKRTSMAHLVNIDTWVLRAEAGPSAEKGQYVRLNYYKVKPGQGAAYLKLETTGWKPFVESLKDSHISWHLHTLLMPSGSYLHYNAMTADVFPTWDAQGKGWPSAAQWPRVHPNIPFADYMTQVGDTAERYGTDLLKIVEIAHAK